MDLGVLEGQTKGGDFSDSIFDPSVNQFTVEPRKAGTSWNKYWNRLLTIKTDHYEPISAQGKAKFRVKKVRKWPKIDKHGTANAVLGHFGLKWLF